MNNFAFGTNRSPSGYDDDRVRYERWGVFVQTRENIDDYVFVNRLTSGWHQPQTLDESFYHSRQQSAALLGGVIDSPKTDSSHRIAVKAYLMGACFLCLAASLWLIIYFISQNVTPSTGLLAGLTLVIILYELWLVACRILSKKEK
jgi:hypothetical protein